MPVQRNRVQSRTRSRLWSKGAAWWLFTFVLLVSCGGTETSQIRIGLQLEPPTLDLTTSPAAAIPQVLLYNVYEGLLKLDAEGEFVPLLAESWSVSGDGLEYRFELRSAQFHNGDEFTAAEAKFSLVRTRNDPDHPFSDTLSPIETISTPDDRTLLLNLSKPSANLLFYLTQGQGVIFPPGSVRRLASQPVGTGPYRFDEWVPGDSISLTRNPEYWGERSPTEQIKFRYINDPSALNNAMLAGDIDILAGVSAPEAIASFIERDDLRVYQGLTHGQVTMAINTRRPPLDRLEVRQAISYAIDRQAIIDGAYAGFGTPIGSHTTPLDPYYLDLTDRYPYQPETARELLALAGVEDLKLRLMLPPVSYAQRGGVIVAAQLLEVGIEVELQNMEWAEWLERVFSQQDYDLSIVAHVELRDLNKYADPDYYWAYDNPTVAEWLDQADAEPAPDRRLELYHRVQRQITEDATNVWLFLLPALSVTKAEVQGYVPEPAGLSLDVTSLSMG